MTALICATCTRTTGVRLYACGTRCPDHTPAANARRPEPGTGRYCPPAICWCGACPHADAPRRPAPTHTAIDTRHVLSGKRRSTPAEYAAARNQGATR